MSISAQPHSTSQRPEIVAQEPAIRIEVARAMPRHAHALQQIYRDGRIAAQPFGDLTATDMHDEFADPNSTLEGRTTAQWEEMIMDQTAHGVVFASFVVLNPHERVKSPEEDRPRGVARAVEIDNVNYLKNLYVAQGSQGQGHGSALFNRVKEEFEGGEMRIRTAAHNTEAITFYKKQGCTLVETAGLGYMIRGVYMRQVELVSPAN